MNTGNCTYDVCAYLNCVHFFCICVVKLNIFSKNKNFNSLCYSILYVLDFRIFNWCSKICARDETMSFKPVMFICTYTYALKICYGSRNSSTYNLIFSYLGNDFLFMKNRFLYQMALWFFKQKFCDPIFAWNIEWK